MATIPLYEEQQKPPASTNPWLRDASSDVRKYREVSGLADDLLKRAEELQRQSLAIDAIDTLKDFTDQWGTFMRGEISKQGKDTFGNIERATVHFENMKREFEGKLPRRVYEAVYPQMHNIRNGSIERLATHRVSEGQAVVKSRYNMAVSMVQQAIISGVDFWTMEKLIYGDQTTPGIIDTVDELNPGVDNTALKVKLEQELWKEYLETEAIRNPVGVPLAAAVLADRLPADIINKALAKGELVEAMRDLRADPESFDPELYKNLDDKTKIQLKDQAIKLADSNLRKAVATEDRLQKKIDKLEKELRAKTEVDALIRFEQDRITMNEIESLARERRIGADLLKYFINKKTEGRDDPIIVGEIARMVEQKMDVSNVMRQALLAGKMKSRTYIEMMKQVGNDAYWKGLTKLEAGLKPTEMDKWNMDRHLKWEQGFTYYNELIAGGKDPVQAAEIVLDGHYSKLRRTMATLPIPRFFPGHMEVNMATLGHIDNAIKVTKEKLYNKAITPEEYKHEIELLKTYDDLIRTMLKEEVQGRINEREGKTSTPTTRVPEKNRPLK